MNTKKEEMFVDLCQELVDTYESKNHDYGDSSHKTYEKFGFVSYATRMNDKLNRFEQLCVFNADPKVNESARDTLMDLASYAIQAVIEMQLPDIIEIERTELEKELACSNNALYNACKMLNKYSENEDVCMQIDCPLAGCDDCERKCIDSPTFWIKYLKGRALDE